MQHTPTRHNRESDSPGAAVGADGAVAETLRSADAVTRQRATVLADAALSRT